MNEQVLGRAPDVGLPFILVVDDDVLIRLDLAEQLRWNGLVVIEAGNAEEAGDVLGTVDGIGVLITDICMPGRSGVELSAWARASFPQLRIILASSGPKPSASYGYDDFVAKPYAMHDMIDRARFYLSNERF